MNDESLCGTEPSPDVAPLELVQHLDAALVADNAGEKDYHIREALQLFVVMECR